LRRFVSDKCSLAARADAFHKDKDGSTGRKLREDIEKKFKNYKNLLQQEKKNLLQLLMKLLGQEEEVKE